MSHNNCTSTTSSSNLYYDSAGNAQDEIESYNITDDVIYNIPLPKFKRIATKTPASTCTASAIGAVQSRRVLRVLIKISVLPRGVKPRKLNASKVMKTLAGIFTAADTVTLRDTRLPKFDKNRRIEEQKALVFDTTCRYDIIFGTDFLSKIGININYETGFMEWHECILPLRDPFSVDAKCFNDMEDTMFVQTEDELLQ